MDFYWLINFGTFPNNQDNGNVTIAVVHAEKTKAVRIIGLCLCGGDSLCMTDNTPLTRPSLLLLVSDYTLHSYGPLSYKQPKS